MHEGGDSWISNSGQERVRESALVMRVAMGSKWGRGKTQCARLRFWVMGFVMRLLELGVLEEEVFLMGLSLW